MDPAKRGQPLDEDDEFEEFDVDDWGPEQADPSNAAMWDRAWDADEGPGTAPPPDAVGQHLRVQAERLARQGGGTAAQQQQMQQQQQQQQQAAQLQQMLQQMQQMQQMQQQQQLQQQQQVQQR